MNLLLILLLFHSTSYGETRVYEGEAFQKGVLAYREKHTSEYLGNKIASSMTIYTDPNGKVVGKLTSDYRTSVNVPQHEMEDRSGVKFGVRYEKNVPVMYRIENGKEETREVTVSGSNELLVAGQGLHYWILQNLDEILSKGKVDLLFLIPGKLDAYDFYLKVIKFDSETAVFEVEIDSWFLRLFAPKLILFYDRKAGRLTKYSGLSNIQTEKKEIMNVDIIYKY